MIAFIRFTPKMIEKFRECLLNLPPEQQVLCNVLFWSAFVLFFVAAYLLIRENNGKKLFTPFFVCFSLFTLLMCGSLLMLGLGCS